MQKEDSVFLKVVKILCFVLSYLFSVQNQTYWLVHDFNPGAQEAEMGGGDYKFKASLACIANHIPKT